MNTIQTSVELHELHRVQGAHAVELHVLHELHDLHVSHKGVTNIERSLFIYLNYDFQNLPTHLPLNQPVRLVQLVQDVQLDSDHLAGTLVPPSISTYRTAELWVCGQRQITLAAVKSNVDS